MMRGETIMKDKKFISTDVFIGVFLTITTFIFLVQAMRFPGRSKYFPTFVLVTLLVLSICLIGVGIYKTILARQGKKDFTNPEMKIRPFFILGSVFVYIFCMGKLGFFSASALFLPCGMLLFGQRKPLIIIGSTIGVLVYLYWMFVIQLRVTMPKGILF